MPDYLIIKLQGAIQAWGGHTYEDYRPSLIFPTRSAIVGLLGACLGVQRDKLAALKSLSDSFEMTVRADKRKVEQRHKTQQLESKKLSVQKITDYHTVLDARKVDGKMRKDAIVSRREYLCDAEFTLAIVFKESALYSLEQVWRGIQQPVYTPFLGRRSCPIHQPLCDPDKNKAVINAETALAALNRTGSVRERYTAMLNWKTQRQ